MTLPLNFNVSLSQQSEKLTKREVEAKICNLSLSNNSVRYRKLPALCVTDLRLLSI